MQTERINFRQEFISENRKRGFSVNDRSIFIDFIKQGNCCTTRNKLSLLPVHTKIGNENKEEK